VCLHQWLSEYRVSERFIALVEEGNLTTTEAGRQYGVPDRTARRWIELHFVTEETSRCAGMGFWHVSTQAEDTRFVDEAEKIHFSIPSS
jgi:transposase-like protein